MVEVERLCLFQLPKHRDSIPPEIIDQVDECFRFVVAPEHEVVIANQLQRIMCEANRIHSPVGMNRQLSTHPGLQTFATGKGFLPFHDKRPVAQQGKVVRGLDGMRITVAKAFGMVFPN